MNDPIFRPVFIGPLELKNRILMPAMHLNMCKNFLVTEQLISFYRTRAEGGAGLLVVWYATVDEYSGSPTNIGAHLDEHVQGLRQLATAIREGGAKSAIQLNHAGRYNPSFFLGGKQPVAPSPVPSKLTGETPVALTQEEILAVVRRFGEAAVRAKTAGFDCVEVLAGTGYLISEFLSPLTNKREDSYFGSLTNRMRCGLEVITEIQDRVGPDFPLMVRLNGNDFMEGGIGPDELLEFAIALGRGGVPGLSVNVGWHEARVPQIVTRVPRGAFAYLARDIKRRVSVPVVASHRINDPQTARMLITEKFCDLVAIGRGLIADPELPRKIEEGREAELVHCVACGQGCFDNIFKMRPVECICNPRAGHEYEAAPVQVTEPKKVVVVGGGVAGMSAAIGCAERGHKVILCEASLRLGGQLHLAGAAPGRQEFLVFAEDLVAQVGLYDIDVRLNCRVDKNFLEMERPDHMVIATGAEPIVPALSGVDAPSVVQAWDVLLGKVQVGEKVVIIGGGAVGVETALLLAEEGTLTGEELKFLLVEQAASVEKLYKLATRGSKDVTLIELTDSLGANLGKTTRWSMLQEVARRGVASLLKATVLEIGKTEVLVEQAGEQRKIPADTVVLAVGSRSVKGLEAVAKQLSIPCQLVGDAGQPGTVFEANHQGYYSSRIID